MFAGPRSCHVQSASDKGRGDPLARGTRCPSLVRLIGQVEHEVRFAELATQVQGEERSSAWLAPGQNEGRVGVTDVPARSLTVGARRCLVQRIAGGNRAILRLATTRAPAATRDVQLPCDI